MPLNIVVTNAGRAALVNAQNTGTDPVTITEVGLSETALVPAATDVALAGEFKRVAGVAGDVVAADTIHINMTDDSADIYALRSFALYLDDGTLFAIYGQPDPVLEKTAQSIGALSIDAIFADISAALLTFGNANFLNPPATTETQGIVELATVAEAQAGIDALRALTPASAKAAVLGWLLSQDGSGSGLDADLLDGQHASYFTDIAARLGYTPANKAGDVFTGPISVEHWSPEITIKDVNSPGATAYAMIRMRDSAGDSMGWWGFNGDGRMNFQCNTGVDVTMNGGKIWTVGNDGSGSGLDADLLDGVHLSALAPIANPAFVGTVTVPAYARFNKSGDAGGALLLEKGNTMTLAGDVAFEAHSDRIRLRELGGSYRQFEFSFDDATLYNTYNHKFWHAGNDGSGSGLDADLLDGQDSSYFAPKASPAFTGTPTAPTASTSANTTQVATTAFVQSLITASNILAKLLTSDGAGSGLDADLLDGQHASAFSRLGVGQEWQDVSGSRAGGATYQNTTGRAIQLRVDLDGTSKFLYVSSDNANWVEMGGTASGNQRNFDPIIPDGHWYKTTAGASITRWVELR